MAYRGLTTSGANYLATRLAQELPVEFTKVQIGAGTPAGNPADVTELQNYKLDAKILKKSQENNTVEITIQVVNDNVEQGFYLKEIGVFVNDDTEKLYWYCNEDNAQYIPAKTDSAIAFEIDIKMEVTNVESPILNWSGQGTWVNKDYLEEVLRNYTPNTRQMTAGKGLTGGGNFNSDKTFNVVSANDGIIVNEDNIQLNPVDDLSNSSTTRALAANQGLILDNKDKGIVGGYNGKFPLTSATKGNIYLLENTQKYYICVTDYNGSKLTTPNANFEELSVYTNRSKLDNLSRIKKIFSGNVTANKTITFEDITQFRYVIFRNRTNASDTILFREEFVFGTNFIVSAIAIDATAYSIVAGEIISTTSAKITYATTNSQAIGNWNLLEIIGVY